MHSPTSRSEMINFGLTGREMQDSINVSKYSALALCSPTGVELAKLVEIRWDEWVGIVQEAPWLTNWHRSPIYRDKGFSPLGYFIDQPNSAIAQALFANIVWGIGVDNWLKGENSALQPAKHTRLTDLAKRMGGRRCTSSTNINEAMTRILEMQRVPNPSDSRKYFWDDKIYRGCGMLVPVEVGELDRWLEPMWLKVADDAAAHKRRQLRDATCNS